MMGIIGWHHLEQLSKRHFLTACNNNCKYNINGTYLQSITDSVHLQDLRQVTSMCNTVHH